MKKIAFIFLLLISGFSIFLSSCTTQKIAYFRDLPDSVKYSSLPISSFKDPLIQPDDILSISIQTIDPTTSAPINQATEGPVLGAGSYSAGNQQSVTGFLVDKNGEIELAMIGKVKVAGVSTYEARELIRKRAEAFYKYPNVQLRFANFKVTVLGEVMRPATYTLPNEKVSILDAIGLAGDLTIYGKRENVLLIREKEGKKEFVRFDLSSSEVFKSPYYYLRQNDVIYIEPNKSKIATTDAARTRTYAILGSVLSLLIVFTSRIIK